MKQHFSFKQLNLQIVKMSYQMNFIWMKCKRLDFSYFVHLLQRNRLGFFSKLEKWLFCRQMETKCFNIDTQHIYTAWVHGRKHSHRMKKNGNVWRHEHEITSYFTCLLFWKWKNKWRWHNSVDVINWNSLIYQTWIYFVLTFAS